MIRHYLKIAWRTFKKDTLYSAINIAGLSIGVAGCMLIIIYYVHESHYDSFHKNADRIFWIEGKTVTDNGENFTSQVSYAVAPIVKQKDPAVESFARLNSPHPDPIIENADNKSLKFAESKFLFADSNFFSFFSFPLAEGNKNAVLQNPFTVVLSEEAAKKYFGNENPVGKIIRYNNKYNFTVTGIADNVPSNSSINFDFVASLSSLSSIDRDKISFESGIVGLGSFTTYFLLRDANDINRFQSLLSKTFKENNEEANTTDVYTAVKLTDTHLNIHFSSGSSIKYLNIFPFISALVLLLALINYVSLSTARSVVRAKEIGVKKALGADRGNIAGQFFTETFLNTLIAFVTGFLICTLLKSAFFNFLNIDIDYSFLESLYILFLFFAFFVITIILAAVYPSLFLSSYKPNQILNGKFSKQSNGIAVRSFFTVFQFTICIALTICGVCTALQMHYVREMNTGVNRENIIMVPFDTVAATKYNVFKNEILNLPATNQVAAAHYLMYEGYDTYFTNAKNTKSDVSLAQLAVDETFISLLNLKWKIAPKDSFYYLKPNSIILNETAVDELNLSRETLNENVRLGSKNFAVAGVLKDFNYESLQKQIGPLCILISPDKDTLSEWSDGGGCMYIQLKQQTNVSQYIASLKKIYYQFNIKPFEYHFMDETFNALYVAEDRFEKISNIFTVFTLLIALLGLFGLTKFITQQRLKEISVRKVLGASSRSIISLLSKDFIVLILISILIASPIAWWVMTSWLQSFAYRINLSWWVFLVTDAGVAIVVITVVCLISSRTSNANPIKNLRNE